MNEHSNEIDGEEEIAAAASSPLAGAGDSAPADDDAKRGAVRSDEIVDHRAATQRGADVGRSRVRTNDYVPAHAVEAATPQWFGFALGALLVLGAVAAAFFLYSSDDTDSSSLVARRAEPTTVATPTPVATPEPTETPAPPTATPVPAAPGPITVLDRAAGSSQFSILAGAVGAAGLDGELASRSPITVFAPTDAAFEKVDLSQFSESEIEEILAYHVIDGQYGSDDLNVGDSLETITGEPIVVTDDSMINNQAVIIDTDIEASNGVIHAIDTVLLPRAFGPTVGDLIDSDPQDDLSSLASSVESMGLRDALDQEGPITVFAPTNAAFDEASEVLATTDDDRTTAVLAYHVVPGEFPSSDLSIGQELTTVQGETIVITEGVTLNDDASVVEADLLASNGVVHKIDRVLVPGTFRTEQALNDLFALEPIQFATASARILSDSEPVLDQAIETLTANPTGAVEVEGHTDSVGGEASNESLSQRRAESVVDYLIGGGVDADRLTAIGYGETRLKINPEESAADRQQNRRIEFRIG